MTTRTALYEGERFRVMLEDAGTALRDPRGSGLCLIDFEGFGLVATATLLLGRMTGIHTMHLVGRRSERNTPYGVLAPYLDVDAAASGDPLRVLASVRQAITDRAPSGAVIVVVHQPESLDAGTVAVLTQLVQEPRVRLLVLARSMGRLPADLRLLIEDLPIPLAEMPVLSVAEVRVGTQRALGGIVPLNVALDLHRVSNGHPEVLARVIHSAVASGVLRLTSGYWRLDTELELDADSVRYMRGRMAEYSPAERDILVACALAHAVPEAVLSAWRDEESVQMLRRGETLHQLETEGDGPVQLTPRSTLSARAIRAAVGPAESYAVWRDLSALLPVPTHAAVIFRSIVWPLECGAVLEPQDVLTVTRRANQLNRPDLARRVTEAASGEPSERFALELGVQQARTLFMSDETEMSLLVIAELVDQNALNSTVGGQILALTSNIYYTTGQGEQLFRRIRQNIAEAEGEPGPRAPFVRSEEFLTMLSHAHQGNYRTAGLAIPERMDWDDGDRSLGDRAVWEMCTGVVVASAGDMVRGTDMLELALRRVQAVPDLGTLGSLILSHLIVFYSVSASWSRFDALIDRLVAADDPLLTQQGAAITMAEAVRASGAGRLDEARHALTAAIAMLRERDVHRLRPLVISLAALFARGVRDEEAVGNHLAEYDAMRYPAAPFARGYTETLIIFSRFADGDPGVVDALWGQVERSRDVGVFAMELQSLLLLRRCDDPARVGTELTRVMAAIDMDQAHAMSAYGRGLTSGRPEDQIRAAGLLLDAELAAYAADALGMAFLALEQKPNRSLMARAREVLVRLPRSAQYQDGPLTRVGGAARLTAREAEIARMVARGLTSREIAHELTLSDRTIDGHVQNILTKLGLHSRNDIGAGIANGVREVPRTT